MYVKLNVEKSENAGGSSKVKGYAHIFDWSEVTGGYERDSSMVVIPGSLLFRSGKFIQKIAFTLNSFKGGSKSDGEVDSKDVVQNVEFDFPGKKQEVKEFRNHWKNKDIGIIFEYCDGSTPELYGSPCAPLQMNFESSEDAKGTKTAFKFESTKSGPDVAYYLGTMTFADINTVAADTTTINVTAGPGEYNLTDNTASTALLGLSNATDGAVYALIGSGGSHPATIATGGNWILKNGASWTGITGSKITFRAMKDGASSWKFIEVSRY